MGAWLTQTPLVILLYTITYIYHSHRLVVTFVYAAYTIYYLYHRYYAGHRYTILAFRSYP